MYIRVYLKVFALLWGVDMTISFQMEFATERLMNNKFESKKEPSDHLVVRYFRGNHNSILPRVGLIIIITMAG